MRDPHRPLDQHQGGKRVEVLGHACPDCPVGAPQPFCRTCLGAGLVTTLQLNVWQLRHLAEADV